MNSFLDKVSAFLDVASGPAADACDKGAEALHELAEFLRALGAGRPMAMGPDVTDKLDACLSRCRAACSPQVQAAVGPGVLAILQIVLAVLEILKKQS